MIIANIFNTENVVCFLVNEVINKQLLPIPSFNEVDDDDVKTKEDIINKVNSILNKIDEYKDSDLFKMINPFYINCKNEKIDMPIIVNGNGGDMELCDEYFTRLRNWISNVECTRLFIPKPNINTVPRQFYGEENENKSNLFIFEYHTFIKLDNDQWICVRLSLTEKNKFHTPTILAFVDYSKKDTK